MKPSKLRDEIFGKIKSSNPKFEQLTDTQLNNLMFLQPLSHRLTIRGSMAMACAFTPYHFDNNLYYVKTNVLLAITRNIEYPFFISNDMLILFSREDAFLLKICGNDVELWSKQIVDEKE